MFADPLTEQMAAFIAEIGLPIEAARLDEPTVLPGIDIMRGVLRVDEARLTYPGDLLHEAGHLAVCEPAVRPTLDGVGDDPAEEMAAIAWSYAAARHLEIDPQVVLHGHGYGGGGAGFAEDFARGAGGGFGWPMLVYFGMARNPLRWSGDDPPPFPHMLRWLR